MLKRDPHFRSLSAVKTAMRCMNGPGYPRHRENRENDQKNSLSGKTQGIWKVCQNTGKTQEIWFAQVVNSLILKVKDISIFAVKILKKKLKQDKSA